MKLKKILTCILFGILTFTGLLFGCKDKYKDFNIEINGGLEAITLCTTTNFDDNPESMDITINIKNAPNESCKDISWSVSKANIVDVKFKSETKNSNTFTIKAFDNISSYDPSTVITFKTAEGNKTCQLRVNVEIPITGLTKNENYSPYVVADGENYYINTSSALTFHPSNTTERDVIYSLIGVKHSSGNYTELGDAVNGHGITVSNDGKISVNNYLYQGENEEYKGKTLTNLTLKATSKKDNTKNVQLSVDVYRAITKEDIVLSYDFDGIDGNYNFDNEFTGQHNTALVDCDNCIDSLLENGITFASNREDMKEADFGILLKDVSGLTYDKVEVEFEKMALSNLLVEENNTNNVVKKDYLRLYKMYTTNPGVDNLRITIKYKEIDGYEKTFDIPIMVREYPISLVVNNSEKDTYNIFDYYENNIKGQEFKVNISKAGAYDKTFKVQIDEDDFDLIDVRYQNEILDYETLTSFVFPNNSSLFIKTKTASNTANISIKFVSSILLNNDGYLVGSDGAVVDYIADLSDEDQKLIKVLNLNLLPGIRDLNFTGIFAENKDLYYLQSEGKTLNVEYLINKDNNSALNQSVTLETVNGGDLITINKDSANNVFTLISKNKVGYVTFYLISENGVETEQKTIYIYNYDVDYEANLTLDLTSNNIKQVENEEDKTIVNYIGVTTGKNSANIKVLNPNNASIYSATISSSDETVIKTSVISKDNLTFNLYALKNVTNDITITISICVYNKNEFVNTTVNSNELELDFSIKTYLPIEDVLLNENAKNGVIIIDGSGLDYNSLVVKELNKLVVSDYVSVLGGETALNVDYIFPTTLVEGVDYELKDSGFAFKNVLFHAGYSHGDIFKNNDGKFVFSFTIKISDFENSREYYLISLKVSLQQQVVPYSINVLNEDGYIYLKDTDSMAQIKANVVSETGAEVTNSSLSFEIVDGYSVTLDKNTGIINVAGSGITKIKIKSNASQQVKDGPFSVTKDIYIVVADGSKNYPYILEENSNIVYGKYYTLNKNFVLNNSIPPYINGVEQVFVGGIDGQFVYANYTNRINKDVVYNLIYNGENSLFASSQISYELKNLNIVINNNILNISNDFGFVAQENLGTINNVKLNVQNITINSTNSSLSVGAMFARNSDSGSILNSAVSGNIVINVKSSSSSLLSNNKFMFGGIVGENNGKVIGAYEFVSSSINDSINSNLNIKANIDNENIDVIVIGGIIGANSGEVSNLKANEQIYVNTNANVGNHYIGGLVGKFVDDAKSEKIYSNLYFEGNIFANSATSKIGGIAGFAQNSKFELLTVLFTENFISSNMASLKGNSVGGLFSETINADIEYSYVASFIDYKYGYVDLEGTNVGGLIATATNTELKAVYSTIKINSTNAGALVNEVIVDEQTVNISDAYSFATGSDYLINNISGKGILNLKEIYSTTCYIYDDNKTYEDLTINAKINNAENADIFDKNNYTKVYSVEKFKDSNCFAIGININNGLPYLVYNENGQYKKLLTIEPTFISANFVTGNKIENSNTYYYGLNSNVMVLNENHNTQKAIIFYQDNLSYNIKDLINLVYNQDAYEGLIVINSSNTKVISISEDKSKLIVNGTGNVTISFSYARTGAYAEVYISVVDKVASLSVLQEHKEFVVSNGHSKLFNSTIVAKNTENIGLYFSFEKFDNLATDDKFNTDLSNILYNNNEIKNAEIYTIDSMSIFKGNAETDKIKYQLNPYYVVSFGGADYNFIDLTKKIEGTIQVLNGATSIYSDVSKIDLTEKESVSFNVFTKALKDESANNIDFLLKDSSNNVAVDENLLIQKEFVDYIDETDENHYKITITGNAVNIQENIIYTLRIKDANIKEIYVDVLVELKSSKLISIEMNHYSSNVIYYDDYNSIIQKEANTNSEIVAGNLGVLNINLYPSYASLTKVEIISPTIDGSYIQFNQLAYKNGNLVVIPNAGNIKGGISLYPNKTDISDGITSFDGNLYVSTLLSSNFTKETIFTITVICTYAMGENMTSTIDLKAKAMTGIVLSNVNNSEDFYLAKGGKLELNVTKISTSDDDIQHLDFIVKPIASNFDIMPEAGLDYLGKVFQYTGATNEDYETGEFYICLPNENGTGYTWSETVINVDQTQITENKLILYCDIYTLSGLKFSVTPTFEKIVNGKLVTAESNSILVEVVDFVVNDISIENANDGILENNLGNVTRLKAKLDVDKYENSNYGESVKNNIDLKIKTLEEQISKSNFAWNLITKNASGNIIYNNIKDNTSYINFNVSIDQEGYYTIIGRNISNTDMVLKVNINYVDGQVILASNANKEFLTEFAITVKTNSSKDHPVPIKTVEEFMSMEEGQDYILLNDITLPATFEGLDTKISSFDGNNKIINLTGFTINNTTTKSLGLFKVVNKDTIIKNVTVNIKPNFFYNDGTYYYGLNINAQALTEFNFGVIAGENNGVITNSKVVNYNYEVLNNKNIYKEITIIVNSLESTNLNLGGFVGVNNGYITKSKVGDRNSANSIKILATANIGGFVAQNNNKIASSYVVNTTIYNNAKTKYTGGFVAQNNSEAQIITSYVEGYFDRTIQDVPANSGIEEGGLFSSGTIGGFVTINSGKIKDCYSNIKVTTNKRSAGFVYDNSTGYVETCYSASINGGESLGFRYFTGNNEENIVLNNKGVVYSYYYLEGVDKNGEDDEYLEPANGISNFTDSNNFEGFVCDNSSSTIWQFKNNSMPTLYDANSEIVSERELINNENTESKLYNYIYVNNNIGSINNPIIISSSNEFFEAMTDVNNLHSYYFNGKIQQTKINYNHINIVKDINLSTIIDANNKISNSESQVQKLQDIIFAGNLNGNGMTINKVTITAKNDTEDYSSFGLFKQIGVELSYTTKGEIYNEKLDEDSCTVLKNLNLDIESISATLTRSVGTLTGEVLNSKLYNINVSSDNAIAVTGYNIVGGVAGRVSGNSYVKGVTSSLSAYATFDNKSNDYALKLTNEKKIYKNNYAKLTDELNNRVNYAGGLFGVVDIYKTKINNFSQKSDENSYYIIAEIDRINAQTINESRVQYVKVTGDMVVTGDIVGGLFGYVGQGSIITDAKFVLNDSGLQHLNGTYAVGGIAGENKGFITYSTVELELDAQREKDKLRDYNKSYLFSDEKNTALYVGGLVGIMDNGILTYSYSKANIVAKNSDFVGASVGGFSNSVINFVYANAYLEAQDKTVDGNIVVQNMGYAGFIGKIVNFDSNSKINHAVSIIRNDENKPGYEVAGLVGYNSSSNVEITASEFSVDLKVEDVYRKSNYGYEISDTHTKLYYEDFVNQSSFSFNGYITNSEEGYWVITEGKDVYPRLTHNKKGSVTSILNGNDLANMLANGDYQLERDIYLTEAWTPISEFKGTFSSKIRPENEWEDHGYYYKIYNLNINETSSKGNLNNIGFFANTNGATIENITFVVGSKYKDPNLIDVNGPAIESNFKLKNNIYDCSNLPSEDNVYSDSQFGTSIKGIKFINQSLDTNSFAKYNLGTISANDYASVFENLNVVYYDEAKIETNLENVGGLIGNADNSLLKDISIENLKIHRDSISENVEKRNDTTVNVGGLIGNLTNLRATSSEGSILTANTMENINVKNAEIIADQSEVQINIGGVIGNAVAKSITNVNLENINIEKITNIGSKANYVNAGLFAGYLKATELLEVVVKDSNLNINFANEEMKVGGLVGENNGTNYSTINFKSNNKVDVATNNNQKSQNYVGGLIGQSINGEITNIIVDGEISLHTNGSIYIGGLIGQNGAADKGNGSNVSKNDSKVFVKNNITVRDSANVNSGYIGGAIGYNYKASLKNVYAINNIVAHTSNLDYVGGLIGGNIGDDGALNTPLEPGQTQIINSYFIEDLCLIASRDNEFGTVISYNEFLDRLTTSNESEKIIPIYFIDETKKEFNDEDIDISGNFVVGSIYAPIEFNSENIIDEDGHYILEDNEYYVLNADLELSETIETFKGRLIGNGKTITIANTFADEIKENAIVSSVVFKLTPNESIKNTEFTKSVETIIANTNNGAIYNDLVVGNLYIENEGSLNNIAPVVKDNTYQGYINVVTSNSRIVITKISTSDTTLVSGFVAKNSGTILNSLSAGNIEIFASDYNIISKNEIGQEDLLSNLAGFVSDNHSVIVNCVSTVNLPETKSEFTGMYTYSQSFKNATNTAISKNCYVDVFANGNADLVVNSTNNTQHFVETEKLYDYLTSEKITTREMFVNDDIGILYGYKYPTLSVYRDKDFIKPNVKTTETGSDGNTYYLVNSFGVLNKVIDTLNNYINAEDSGLEFDANATYYTYIDSEYKKVETNDEADFESYYVLNTIYIKQTASINAKVYVQDFVIEGKNKYKTTFVKSNYIAKNLITSLVFEGNNYAINGLTIVDANNIDNNNYFGLFFTEKDNVEIIINNLALKNINYEFGFTTGEGDKTDVIGNIYAGGFVPYTNSTTNLTNCYIDGEITIKESPLTDFIQDYDLVVGGIIGYGENSSIENSASNVNINLDYLYFTNYYDSSDECYKFVGYNAQVGGVAGVIENSTISNCYSTGDIGCSSAVSLNMGGIVGNINGGTLLKISTLSTIAYKGAYRGYYLDENENLIYNINAVAGKIEGSTVEEVKFNPSLSLVEDAKIIKVSLSDIISNSNFEINNFTKIEQSQTYIAKLPIFEIIEDESDNYELKIEDNKYYILSLPENSLVTIKKGESTSNIDLTNVGIVFENQVIIMANSDAPIFNLLDNCIISNLIIKTDDNLKCSTAVFANEVKNSKLYNITAENIYVSRASTRGQNVGTGIDTGESAGLLIDIMDNSLLSNINIVKGRLEISTDTTIESNNNVYVGAIAGKMGNSNVTNSINSATITIAGEGSFTYYTAGLVGYAYSSSIFNSKNEGLVYSKLAQSSIYGNLYTSGIANAEDNKTYISFCVNNAKIKGVNLSIDSNSINIVSGISTNGTVLYSANNNNILSISGINNNNVLSVGLNASPRNSSSTTTLYSYNIAAVTSSGYVYSITNKTAYYCYSLSGGYAQNAIGEKPKIAWEGKYNYNDKTMNTTQFGSSGEVWFAEIIKCADMGIKDGINYTNYKSNLTDFVEKYPSPIYLPKIKLITEDMEEDVLKTDDTGKTYLISSAFELWFWGLKGKPDYNVKILDDIDMTGFEFQNGNNEFTGTFDGGHYTISSMNFKGKEIHIYEDVTFGDSIDYSELYYGLVNVNNGTIQNIYFENPLIRIDSKQEFQENNFIGIVAGSNSGTIDNILVGQTDVAPFIEINYETKTMKQADTSVYIGTITGKNSNTVVNCEVINLSGESLSYSISITEPVTGSPNNIKVYGGGICGYNKGSITECYFIGGIKGSVYNNNMYCVIPVGENQDILEALAYAHYSTCSHYVGYIVGKNEGKTLTGCYSLDNIGLYDVGAHNLDKTLFEGALDTDLYSIAHRVERAIPKALAKSALNIVAKQINKISLVGKKITKGVSSVFSKISQPLVSHLLKKGQYKLAGSVTKINPWLIIDLALTAEQQYHNSHSLEFVFNDEGSSVGGYPSEYGLDSAEISIYTQNQDDGNNSIYDAYKDLTIPYLDKFLNLSNTKKEPETGIYNGKYCYYVKNANELAYALTQSSIQTIVLSQHIDVTRKVWDEENLIRQTQTPFKIIDNGFNIIAGSNYDKLTSIYPEILNEDSSILEGQEDIQRKILVRDGTTEDYNSFGQFEAIIKNDTARAYQDFEQRFKDVYIKESGLSEASAILKYNDDSKNGDFYPIRYTKQLEIIADAMSTYSYDNTMHKGIDFLNKKFKLLDNLDISDLNLYSLDEYMYSFKEDDDGRALYEIVYSDGTTTEEPLPLIEEWDHMSPEQQNKWASVTETYNIYKVPDFVQEDQFTTNITVDSFKGEFYGNGYTITTDKTLFVRLEQGAILTNLTIQIPQETTSIETMFSDFGFVCLENRGTITNVNVKVPQTLTFDYEFDYLDTTDENTKCKLEVTKKDAPLASAKLNVSKIHNVSLVVAQNYGIIDNCNIQIDNTSEKGTGNLEVSINQKMYISNITLNENIYNEENTEEGLFASWDKYVHIDNNFGAICAVNCGQIANINFNNLTVAVNNSFVDGEDTTGIEGVKISKGQNSYNMGLIVGNATYLNGSESKLENINIKNSTLKLNTIPVKESEGYTEFINAFENTSVYLGVLAGYCSIDIANCKVFASQLLMNNDINNVTSWTGDLVGVLSPEIYTVIKQGADRDNETGLYPTITVGTSYTPTIKNTICENKPVGQYNEYIISQGKKPEGEDYYESIIYFNKVADISLDFYFADPRNVDFSKSDYGADNFNIAAKDENKVTVKDKNGQDKEIYGITIIPEELTEYSLSTSVINNVLDGMGNLLESVEIPSSSNVLTLGANAKFELKLKNSDLLTDESGNGTVLSGVYMSKDENGNVLKLSDVFDITTTCDGIINQDYAGDEYIVKVNGVDFLVKASFNSSLVAQQTSQELIITRTITLLSTNLMFNDLQNSISYFNALGYTFFNEDGTEITEGNITQEISYSASYTYNDGEKNITIAGITVNFVQENS